MFTGISPPLWIEHCLFGGLSSSCMPSSVYLVTVCNRSFTECHTHTYTHTHTHTQQQQQQHLNCRIPTAMYYHTITEKPAKKNATSRTQVQKNYAEARRALAPSGEYWLYSGTLSWSQITWVKDKKNLFRHFHQDATFFWRLSSDEKKRYYMYACVRACVRTRARVCVCVCVCVRERQKIELTV